MICGRLFTYEILNEKMTVIFKDNIFQGVHTENK